MKRFQLSGAQNRKLAQERKQKQLESLKNIPKISDLFRANVARSSSNTETNIEEVCDEHVRSEVVAVPSEQNNENENIRSGNEISEFNDETIDFDVEHDNFDELFLNVSTSSRHHDNETQCEIRTEAVNQFPTDVALWDLVADISLLQRYWTKLGNFFPLYFEVIFYYYLNH